jgi:hypothetical protein
MRKLITFLVFCTTFIAKSYSQTGEVRGFVYMSNNGEPLGFVNIIIKENRLGTASDENGFYSIAKLEPGKYTLICTSLGYDSSVVKIEIKPNRITKLDFFLKESSYDFNEITVSAEKLKKETTTTVGEIKITPKQLKQIPTVGGEPDLVQYLQVLPGVVFSGDQGGQLYIRGGSPVMNKVLLDGMTIYNPFHSIGLFSVFDADIIKSVDVYSAGYGAEYGGRISAIVDVKTRDGNKNNLAGKINTNPFTSKLLLEGPLKKFKQGKGNSSFIVSYKNSYLDKSANIFYNYVGTDKLPYSFSDLYTKLSFNASNGSKINFFYFDFKDKVDFKNTTSYGWTSKGFGSKFLLIPDGTKTIIDGNFAYSKYLINQKELDNKPRSSGIDGFDLGLNFNYFINNDELHYGMQLTGFKTDFQIYNSADRYIVQTENTTELNAFINYKKVFKKRFIFEPGFRLQHYASLNNTSPEPRLRLKYLITKEIRFKTAGGFYSQNLISAISDRDVVNLFYGFLSGPDDLPQQIGDKAITNRMQTSRHAVAGFEFDPTKKSEINVEAYIKDFTQIANINRDKIYDDNRENQTKPEQLRKDFIVETGVAKGFDVTYKFTGKQLYLWTVYSYNIVNRYDGVRFYQPHFDRRHNINVVTSYGFGKKQEKEYVWECNLRWNFGSGFPFTLTQGFYENIDFAGGANSNYTTDNGSLGINYAQLNTGRLPYYHRLDFSTKRTINMYDKKTKALRKLEVIASCTNVYNRENIFYFDRVSYKRVNQLPILPSIAISYSF